jgi:hypothetical protein
MDKARRVLVLPRDEFRQHLYEWDCGIACAGGFFPDGREIKKFYETLCRNFLSGARRNYACAGFRMRQRGLEVEHALQSRRIRECALDSFEGKKLIEESHRGRKPSRGLTNVNMSCAP